MSSSTTTTSASDADVRAPDYDFADRRTAAAATLESWELLAMHSIANDESIARVRLRMLKKLTGLPEEEPASVPGSGRRRAAAAARD